MQALARMGDQHLRLRGHGSSCPSLDHNHAREAMGEETGEEAVREKAGSETTRRITEP